MSGRLLVGWWLLGATLGLAAITGIDTVARICTVTAPGTPIHWLRTLIATAICAAAIAVALTIHHDRKDTR